MGAETSCLLKIDPISTKALNLLGASPKEEEMSSVKHSSYSPTLTSLSRTVSSLSLSSPSSLNSLCSPSNNKLSNSKSLALSITSPSSKSPAICNDHRQTWLEQTPTGSLAKRYDKFCPICYRYFTNIYVTSCCQHHICTDCTEQYILSQRPILLPLSFIPTAKLPIPCPTCAQNDGVAFTNVEGTVAPRVYINSPRTQIALENAFAASQKTQAFDFGVKS